MRRLLSVLLWSVIAAAFLGPGTVTTAASAGAGYGLALLWALVFSTVATLVLQEASARLAVVSGRDLAAALRQRSRTASGGVGARGVLVLVLVVGAVVVGCAAYEAGNILGGVAGLALAVELPAPLLTLAVVAVAALLLAFGNPRTVARLLAATVAVMGVAFLATAARLAPDGGALVAGSLVPALPAGSSLLVLGLVGTTVVPYNLFLGSGVAAGQTLPELRFGLTVAVGLGGLISMGVLVVGTAVDGPFSFAALSAVLTARLGPWAALLFAAGLAAAGLSSAVTAPLAAAITARGLFADTETNAASARGTGRGAAAGGALVAARLALSRGVGRRPRHRPRLRSHRRQAGAGHPPRPGGERRAAAVGGGVPAAGDQRPAADGRARAQRAAVEHADGGGGGGGAGARRAQRGERRRRRPGPGGAGGGDAAGPRRGGGGAARGARGACREGGTPAAGASWF